MSAARNELQSLDEVGEPHTMSTGALVQYYTTDPGQLMRQRISSELLARLVYGARESVPTGNMQRASTSRFVGLDVNPADIVGIERTKWRARARSRICEVYLRTDAGRVYASRTAWFRTERGDAKGDISAKKLRCLAGAVVELLDTLCTLLAQNRLPDSQWRKTSARIAYAKTAAYQRHELDNLLGQREQLNKEIRDARRELVRREKAEAAQ